VTAPGSGNAAATLIAAARPAIRDFRHAPYVIDGAEYLI
jgi:hypothetical protein